MSMIMDKDDFKVPDDEKCAICIDDLENKDYYTKNSFFFFF